MPITSAGLLASLFYISSEPIGSVYYNQDDWDVSKHKTYCNAITYSRHPEFGLTVFSIAFSSPDRGLLLQFTSKVPSSLPNSGSRVLDYTVRDAKTKTLSTSSASFEFERSPSGLYVFRHLLSSAEAGRFLDRWKKSDGIMFAYATRTFAGAAYEGALEAQGALRRCSAEVTGSNSLDPFRVVD